MGYFDSALGKLRDSAIDFICHRVRDVDGWRITLDPRLVVNVEVGDVGMSQYDGVEKWSIQTIRVVESGDDIVMDVCAGEGAIDNPDPISFEQLCTTDIIALADLLDSRVYKEQTHVAGT